MPARKNIKKHILFKLSIIALLLFLPIYQAAQANNEQTQENLITYPSTPKGVVEAFVKEDFTGARKDSAKDISTSKPFLKKYATSSDRSESIISTIVTKYKITKMNETFTTAEVKVEYFVAGDLIEHPFGLEWRNRNKIGEVYNLTLIKQGNYWKIRVPYELDPHISVEVAIKRLGNISNERILDKKKEMKKRNQIISILKKYEENPSTLITYILQSLDINNKITQKQFNTEKENYPLTPEGVVDAYLKIDFDDGWEQRQKFASYVAAPESETTLISNYKIKKISEESDRALVKTDYEIIGYFAKSEAGIHFRKSGKAIETYIFDLVRHNDLWQIKSPIDHQYELLETRIHNLEYFLREEDSMLEKEKERAREIIKILKSLEVK